MADGGGAAAVRPGARAAAARDAAAAGSEQEHVLLLTMHHIVTDGWSMGVLVRELAALYAACATGQASPLPELPVQYADYAVWQRGWLQGEVLERAAGLLAGSSWRARRRCWSCRPTTRGRRCRASAGRGSAAAGRRQLDGGAEGS